MSAAVQSIRRHYGAERRLLPSPPDDPAVVSDALADLIGNHAAFLAVKRELPALAECEAPLVIMGEPGSGKTLCARTLHRLSARSARPMLAVSCRGISPERFDHEVFGHSGGAAVSSGPSGLLARAEGGTLFLDAIEMLSPPNQVKLLRVLEDHTYHSSGCLTLRRADVWVIAGLDADLRDEVRRGRFRVDLYYRLAVMSLRLPPLRERPSDVPALIQHLWRRHAGQHAITPELSRQARQALSRYSWPGNVGELDDLVRRLAANTDVRAVTLEHLPRYIART